MSTQEQYRRIKETFLSIVDLPLAEQAEALERACGSDRSMAEEVRGLLALSEAPTGWLCPSLRTRTLTKPTEPPAVEAAPDTLLADLVDWNRFRDLEKIGAGGMGTVFRALDPRLKRVVALKFLTGAGPATAERFRREAELQARVDHRNVLEIFETGEAGGHPFIAMRYVQGPRWQDLRGKLALDEILILFRQVAEGVQAAHEGGLIHRDLKPSNLLVEETPQGLRPYVADFGIATEASDLGLGAEGPLGSPRYMAPEQLDGRPGMDHRVDLYGLGATFYEFLAGRPLFPDETLLDLVLKIRTASPPSLARVVPAVPAPLAAIVERCLEKNPDRRYPSARVLATDLELLLRKRRQRPRRWFLAAALTLGLALGGFRLFQKPHEPETLGRAAGAKGAASAITEAERAAQLHREGLSRLRQMDALGARDLLKEALVLAPDNPHLHLVLSRTWLQLGHDDEARTEAMTTRELGKALGEADRLEIEGHLQTVLGDWPEALRIYHRLWSEDSDNVEIGLALASIQNKSGNSEEALETLKKLRQKAGRSQEAPRIDFEEAHARSELAQFEESLVAARRAGEGAATRSSPHLATKARLLEAWALRCLGRLEEAAQAAGEARIIASASGDQRGLSSALAMTAVVHQLQGRPAAAIDDYEEALNLARDHGDRFMTVTLHNNLAALLVDHGELAKGQEHYTAALDIDIGLKNPTRAAILQANIGRIAALRGELEEAQNRYEKALSILGGEGDLRVRSSALAYLAELLLETGDLAQAKRAAQEALRLAREMEGPAEEAKALNLLGWNDRLHGRYQEAAERHSQALRIFRDLNLQAPVVDSLLLLLKLRSRQGQRDEAAALLIEVQTSSLGGEDLLHRLRITTAEAHYAAAFDCEFSPEIKLTELRDAASEVRAQGYALLPLQARLAAGVLDLHCHEGKRAPLLLSELLKEARAGGFAPLARQVQQALAIPRPVAPKALRGS